MTVTRRQIRQALLDEDITGGLYGTATAGAPLQLTDTTLLKVAGNSTSRYGNYYLYRPAAANAADYVRRVTATGYDPNDGELQHAGPNWSVNPLASEDTGYYELWPWNPLDINRAVTRAFQTRLFSIQYDDVTTNGQSVYAIGSAPFSLNTIESPQNQILGIAQVSGTAPNEMLGNWVAGGRTWWPELDNDVLSIRFDGRPTGNIRVAWKKPYAAPDDETDESTVDRKWAAWATLLELAIALKYQAKSRGETSANYEELEAYAYTRYWARRQMFMGRFASQLHVPRPRWTSSASSPRMGRGPSSALGGSGGMTVNV